MSGINRLMMLLKHEAVPGVLLVLAAVVALVAENSLLAALYDRLLSTPVSVTVGDVGLAKPLLLWINDGLMAVFFFLVGLEIKREVRRGALSTLRAASLPAIAAVGGMVVPAAIYAVINLDEPENLAGWAIPAATDIAFALAALALLGSRIPVALKIFLLALAILDDLGAIIVIALFYTADLSVSGLGVAAVGLVLLTIMNRVGVLRIAPYLLIGLVIWVAVLEYGVHATLAGVAIAFMIPLESGDKPSPLLRLEHALHPWVAFFILPVFAFANAGVSLSGISVTDLAASLPLGIAAGLVVGKPVGVLAFVWVAVRLGWTALPERVSWPQIYGVAQLAGIGFTMSLFIGTLAFSGIEQQAAVRLGVLGGSIVSIALGMAALAWFTRPEHSVGPAPMKV